MKTSKRTSMMTTVAAALAVLVAVPVMPNRAAAADLELEPARKVVKHRKVVKIRKVVRAVRVARDYDGTPVYLRPYRTVAAYGPDGAVVARVEYEAVPVVAVPSRHLNGEPVLPHHPRGWPPQATVRYRLMAGLP